MGALIEAVRHLAAFLLQNYVEEGILVHTGAPWTSQIMELAIANGLHVLSFSPDTTSFIRGEMQQRVKDVFIIPLPSKDTVRIFRDKLKLYCILRPPKRIFNCASSLTYW